MNKASKYQNNLCAVSDFKELGRIREFVLKKAIVFGFSDDEAQKISLAVDEACSNLIRHAFNFDSNKKICVEIELNNKDMFVVNILDDGKPFNPLDVESPDMKSYFREFRTGGLGISIMKKVMDDISYTPSDSKKAKNLLQLKKNLS